MIAITPPIIARPSTSAHSLFPPPAQFSKWKVPLLGGQARRNKLLVSWGPRMNRLRLSAHPRNVTSRIVSGPSQFSSSSPDAHCAGPRRAARIPSPGLLEGVAEAAGACLSGTRARDPGTFGARGSRRLPGSVVGIGFGVCFLGNLCSLAGGPGARLAIIVPRPGAGRDLACLAGIIVPRPGAGRGLACLAVIIVPRPGAGRGPALAVVVPPHAVGRALAGVDVAHGWPPQAQAQEQREEERFGGAGTCRCHRKHHCGRYHSGPEGRHTHGNLLCGHGRIHISDQLNRNMPLMGSSMPDYGFGRCDGHHETVEADVMAITKRSIYN